MSSVRASFAERKQKKMMVTVNSARMWTSAQVYTALNLTTLSAPALLLGPASNSSTTNITDENLGSGVVLNADTDLALVFAASGSGLNNVGITTTSAGEMLRPLGKKFTVGTKIYGDLVTLQKIQRTDRGGSTTQGVPASDSAFPQTATVDGDGYGTFWMVTDSVGNLGPVNGNGRGSLTALAPVHVVSI